MFAAIVDFTRIKAANTNLRSLLDAATQQNHENIGDFIGTNTWSLETDTDAFRTVYNQHFRWLLDQEIHA